MRFDKLCDDCDNSLTCLKRRRCTHKERQLVRQQTAPFFHWLGASAEPSVPATATKVTP